MLKKYAPSRVAIRAFSAKEVETALDNGFLDLMGIKGTKIIARQELLPLLLRLSAVGAIRLPLTKIFAEPGAESIYIGNDETDRNSRLPPVPGPEWLRTLIGSN